MFLRIQLKMEQTKCKACGKIIKSPGRRQKTCGGKCSKDYQKEYSKKYRKIWRKKNMAKYKKYQASYRLRKRLEDGHT